MADKFVTPYSVVGNALTNLFTGRRKFKIYCGACRHAFKIKEEGENKVAAGRCPRCQAINQFSVVEFLRAYHRRWGSEQE